MKRDSLFFLKHIAESIDSIKEYTENLTKSEFEHSVEKQDAVIRRLAVIGEAARNIPGEVAAQYSEVSWKEIIGLKNILVHEYFGVDTDIIWQVVQKDLPRLETAIHRMIKELERK